MAELNDYSSGRNRVRTGGSGFTVFRWNGQIIAFARQVAHTSPAPVGPGAVPIHPMDADHPVQVITPAASGMGTLTLELYELYGEQVWERLGSKSSQNLIGTVDLVDIFRTQAAMNNPINVVKLIQPPKHNTYGDLGNAPGGLKPYTEEYHNCVITNVLDGETIEIGTMEVLKQVTVAYTHMTRGGRRSQSLADSADLAHSQYGSTDDIIGLL